MYILVYPSTPRTSEPRTPRSARQTLFYALRRSPPVLRKVLVANRGEIACRILRTLRKLRVRSVAVFSEADRHAKHARVADEAYLVGATPAGESYLRGERILEIARRCGADAIHPGYGFLAENASFVLACERAGVSFIGPSSKAMRRMGEKLPARAIASRVGVPVAPGSDGALRDASHAQRVAAGISYPVILKASGGGGGIGMRVVERPDEMPAAFEAAQGLARGAFGIPDVFLEKFILKPRHIEVQIVADSCGSTLHLFERECSIQRRYQKLIEEAPSPALGPEERARVCAMALTLARAAEYTNAGTIEFLYSGGAFYFNEMNARLQVEHPVTELVTGIDLVEWQVRVAAGEALPVRQEAIRLHGHAIECRVNAENPHRGMAPSPGRVTRYHPPVGEGIRLDDGIEAGSVVPAAYDSLIAKLIAHGPAREAARLRLLRAIESFRIRGIATTLPLHRAILEHDAFIKGQLHTGFLAEHGILEALADARKRREDLLECAAAAVGACMDADPWRVRELLAPASSGAPRESGGAWSRGARDSALRRWPR